MGYKAPRAGVAARWNLRRHRGPPPSDGNMPWRPSRVGTLRWIEQVDHHVFFWGGGLLPAPLHERSSSGTSPGLSAMQTEKPSTASGSMFRA